ncbi:OmpA family protein [Compostibacter hankyongensis]|uniref:OmpA-like domain-containing protein n=1 Tax=Compostibacter hankyongensis TaxID=1007089 RepID=A0ABP8FFC1_9BACT
MKAHIDRKITASLRRYGWALLLLMYTNLHAQYNPAGVPKKAKAYYDKAQQYLDYSAGGTEAVRWLEQAVAVDPGYLEAYAKLGSIYNMQHDYARALPFFEKAFRLDSAFFRSGWIMYAKAAAGTGNFGLALRLTKAYLNTNPSGRDRETAEQWLSHFTFAQQYTGKNIPFSPINLGDSINTGDAEYFPTLTIDQRTLVFTRNLQGHNEDFFFSHLRPDSSWSKALSIGTPVNTTFNEGAQTISQDGRLLLYTLCNTPGGYGSCDIFYTVRTATGWTTPRNIGAPVNTEYWDTQPCLSPDNRDLYFVSNRPGGYGGSDIYVSHLRPGGTWSKPENLGPGINTSGNESSPFIHADNQTLFFASGELPGMGDMDLFFARKNPDGSWGKPENLGYPINTIDHEGSLFVAADGKTAYLASDRADSRGQLDIYRFELYPEARPVKTLFVKGFVYDKQTRERLPSVVDLVDLDSGKTISRVPTDRQGNYLMTLPVGKNYGFNVGRPGYLFYSDNFPLKNQVPDTSYQINIGLDTIRVNAGMILKNIFFDTNKYDLKPESRTELDRLVQLLQQNPSLRIQISGHTDNIGNDEDNLLLSQHRAQSVVDYLTGHGIAAGRLEAKGFGETKPIAGNDTEAGRARNRRTEFLITGQ